MRVKSQSEVSQLCPTLSDPMDCSPLGSSIHGILQARTLEWVAISFSNAWKWKVKVKLLSHLRLVETPWTAAHQAPLSLGFPKQEYWSGTLVLIFNKGDIPLNRYPSKRVPEKHLFLLYWLCQSLWLCGSQQTVENSSRNGNTRPPDLPPEKSVCRWCSNS